MTTEGSPYAAMEANRAGLAGYTAEVTITVPVTVIGHSRDFALTDTNDLHEAIVSEVIDRLNLTATEVRVRTLPGSGTRYHFPGEDWTPDADHLLIALNDVLPA